MAASAIRFGPGVTQEVGMDLKNMNVKRVAVVTDETVDKLDAMRQVREALTREGIDFRVFNKTRVEPKDSSSVPPIPSLNRMSAHHPTESKKQ
jgi:hydroxyacid-oxoacid transhydrogenase